MKPSTVRLDQTREGEVDQIHMSILDSILQFDDGDLLCEEVEEKTAKTSPHSLKRKRDDLEEGEIEEWYTACTGFFFDTSIMKKVPGCVECHIGRYCRRPRRI